MLLLFVLVSITDFEGEGELLVSEGSVETIVGSIGRQLSFTTSPMFIDATEFLLDDDNLL